MGDSPQLHFHHSLILFPFTDHKQPEFAQLVGKVLGRELEVVMSFFSLGAVLGAAIVYWVLMSNFAFFSIQYVHGKKEESEM